MGLLLSPLALCKRASSVCQPTFRTFVSAEFYFLGLVLGLAVRAKVGLGLGLGLGFGSELGLEISYQTNSELAKTIMRQYSWLKVSWNANYAPHYLPCSAHDETTLLILGCPSYFTDCCVQEAMSSYSDVVNISSQARPSQIPKFHPPNPSQFFRDSAESTEFRVVYVNFNSAASLQSVLSSISVMAKPVFVSELKSKPLLGLKRWQSEQQYPDEAQLRAECEQYMAEFNTREKLKMQHEKEMAENPDEDGWVMVTKVLTLPPLPHQDGWVMVTKSSKVCATAEQAEERKRQYDEKLDKKKKEILHLYSFQDREKRKQSLEILVPDWLITCHVT
eukprot:sb/3466591/